MMHIETLAITLRNILLFQLLVVLAFACAGNTLVIHQELLRIWKTLRAPLLQIKSAMTNHASHKFWEIDMTKFEP
jgi:hypothetical protein